MEPGIVSGPREYVRMVKRSYLERMCASLANIYNKEISKRGVQGVNTKSITISSPIKEELPLYIIVHERINETGDPSIYYEEGVLLCVDIKRARKYARQNIDREDHKEVLNYCRMIVEDCNLLRNYSKINQNNLNQIKEIAEGTIEKTRIRWEFPENADQVLKMEKHIRLEEYHEAAEIRDKLNTPHEIHMYSNL